MRACGVGVRVCLPVFVHARACVCVSLVCMRVCVSARARGWVCACVHACVRVSFAGMRVSEMGKVHISHHGGVPLGLQGSGPT